METDFSISVFQRFIEGLQIINEYESDPGIAAEHDIFYCGEYEDIYARMSDADRARMGVLGWIESEASWAFFT